MSTLMALLMIKCQSMSALIKLRLLINCYKDYRQLFQIMIGTLLVGLIVLLEVDHLMRLLLMASMNQLRMSLHLLILPLRLMAQNILNMVKIQRFNMVTIMATLLPLLHRLRMRQLTMNMSQFIQI